MQKLAKIGFPIYICVLIYLLVKPVSNQNFTIDLGFLGIPSDKVIHAILFLPFMVFMRLLFTNIVFLQLLFFGIAFASFCEILHYFILYREFSIYDFYANLVGLFIGSFSFLILKNKA